MSEGVSECGSGVGERGGVVVLDGIMSSAVE